MYLGRIIITSSRVSTPPVYQIGGGPASVYFWYTLLVEVVLGDVVMRVSEATMVS